MHLIREEHYSLQNPPNNDKPTSESFTADAKFGSRRSRYAESSLMFSLFGNNPEAEEEEGKDSFELKPNVFQAIQEFLDELSGVYSGIAEKSVDHIHSK